MKHGRRLTRSEKIFLNSEGLNPEDYLRVKKTADNYTFINRSTGKTLDIRR